MGGASRACDRAKRASPGKETKRSPASAEGLSLEESRHGEGCVICGRLSFGSGKRMANMQHSFSVSINNM